MTLKKSTNKSLDIVRNVAEYLLQNTIEKDIQIKHCICGELYIRKCIIPKDVVAVSALIKVPTVVIIDGDCLVYDGQKVSRVTGYKALQGQAYRESIFKALEDTQITMIAVVKSDTPQNAQKQITDQYVLLTNHRQEFKQLCQV